MCKHVKEKNKKFKIFLDKLKKEEIWSISEKIYEKGYSELDLIEYIKENIKNDEKKYEYLVFIQRIKKEFREEKLLIMIILNFILIRKDYSLENISYM
jgi:hypothetical protein